jgi:hypothetical protein
VVVVAMQERLYVHMYASHGIVLQKDRRVDDGDACACCDAVSVSACVRVCLCVCLRLVVWSLYAGEGNTPSSRKKEKYVEDNKERGSEGADASTRERHTWTSLWLTLDTPLPFFHLSTLSLTVCPHHP